MANYSILKNIIDQVVRTNGQGEITGANLNQTLQEMVTSLGANYQYAGVATPSTNPGSPDQNVFYIATLAGTYSYFNGIVLPKGISVLRWNGAWSSTTLYTVDTDLTPNSEALVESGTVYENFLFVDTKFKELGLLCYGDMPVGSILFDKTQVSPGNLVYVRIKILAGQFAFDFFNDSDQVIATYSSSGASVGDVIERYITIPQGFSYAKTKWQKENYYVDSFSKIIPDEINDIKEIISDKLGNAVIYNIGADTFEIGSIAISTSGWSYSSSTQRIRTKQNVSLHLYPGTVVKTMPNLYSVTPSASYYQFYIGWKNGNAEYKTGGNWLTSFVVQEEGDYVLTMRNIVGGSEQTTTNADDLSKTLFIYSKFERSVYDEVQFNASKAKSHYKSINHRGYNAIAPQNTLPAFVLSKKKGFAYVETDIRQTSDGVYVLLHDASINNVARNMDGTTISETVNIADITYNEALSYDFGIAKGTEFAGTPIARFDDFLALCRNLGLSAYLDLKLFTENYIDGVVKLVRGYGMENQCTFLGNLEQLQFVKARLAKARLGVIATDLSTTVVDNAMSLRDAENEVFVDIQNFSGSADIDTAFDYAKSNGVPVEAWVYNNWFITTQFDSYISGITTDSENYTEQYMDIDLRKFYPII